MNAKLPKKCRNCSDDDVHICNILHVYFSFSQNACSKAKQFESFICLFTSAAYSKLYSYSSKNIPWYSDADLNILCSIFLFWIKNYENTFRNFFLAFSPRESVGAAAGNFLTKLKYFFLESNSEGIDFKIETATVEKCDIEMFDCSIYCFDFLFEPLYLPQ